MHTNLISKAIEIVGLGKLAGECRVTYQALRKWEKAGRLPRTDWTGETRYAEIIEAATHGQVTKAGLHDLTAVCAPQPIDALLDAR